MHLDYRNRSFSHIFFFLFSLFLLALMDFHAGRVAEITRRVNAINSHQRAGEIRVNQENSFSYSWRASSINLPRSDV